MSRRMKKMEIKLPKIPNLDELIRLLGDATGDVFEELGGFLGGGASKITDVASKTVRNAGDTIENYALKNRYDRLRQDPRSRKEIDNALRGYKIKGSYPKPIQYGSDFSSPSRISELSWTRQYMIPAQQKAFDAAMKMKYPTKGDFKTRQAEKMRDLARYAESQLGNASAYTGNLSSRQKKILGAATMVGADLGLAAGLINASNRENANPFVSRVQKRATVKKKHKYM